MNDFLEKHKYKILLGGSIFVVTGFSYYMISSNNACYNQIKHLELQLNSQNARLLELEHAPEPVRQVQSAKQAVKEKPAARVARKVAPEDDEKALDEEIERELEAMATPSIEEEIKED